MDRDVGQFIGLIAIGVGAFVLVLSYVGAYLMGRSHGRRDEQRSARQMEQTDFAQRLSATESTIYGLSASIDRLMDAQRLLVAQQDHLSRKIGLVDRNHAGLPVAPSQKTPS